MALDAAFVVDTNVLLKLFFREEGTDNAILLFKRFDSGAADVFVPDLLPVEFVNILWVKLRQGQCDSRSCQATLRLFLDLLRRLKVVASATLVERILDASVQHNHPAYDMTFLVLAESLGVPFITADASLCRKLSSHSWPPILLKDLDL